MDFKKNSLKLPALQAFQYDNFSVKVFLILSNKSQQGFIFQLAYQFPETVTLCHRD